MLLVAIVAALVVAFHIADMGILRSEKGAGDSDPAAGIQQGDLAVKMALAASRLHLDAKRSAQQAIRNYRRALPWPAAHRRIAFAQRTFLGTSPLPELILIDSPRAVKGLSKKRIKLLHDEVRMWRQVYAGRRLPAAQAEKLIPRVKRLNLGPLKWAAVGEVYARSGQVAKANAALDRGRKRAYRSVVAGIAIVVGLLFAGMAGVGLSTMFLVRYGEELASADKADVDPSVLTTGFVTFMVGSLVIGLIAGLALAAAGAPVTDGLSPLADILVQIAATLIAFAVSVTVTLRLARAVHLSLDRMGLGQVRFWPALRWGVGGYFAALPSMGAAFLISYWLQNTLLRNVPTPEHPIVPFIAQGGSVFWAAFVLATVVAPVVEETVFRGMLYTALRAQMKTWPAALLSGAIFAAVHPTLPGQFLPIMALGVVLALLREKTGSLAPSMVCHAVNNAVMLTLVRVTYGG